MFRTGAAWNIPGSINKFLLVIMIVFIWTYSAVAQHQHRIEEAKTKAESLQKSFAKNYTMTDNQGGYDVKHYQIAITFDPARSTIYGMVEVTAEIISGSLSTIDLDLADNMNVDSVFCAGLKSTFQTNSGILTISLDQQYSNGQQVSVAVYYNGHPQPSGLGSFGFDSYNGKPLIWSLSEPYGARQWWPCKDAPSDKADSVDIKYTVPQGMIAASNGLLEDETTINGKTTFWWKVRYPITTYLISIAAYEYTHYTEEFTSITGETMNLEFFVSPDHYQNAVQSFSVTKDMITIYENLFGPYPFIKEKYGHAEFPWGGGMEHQTITSLGNIHYSNGFYSRGLIAHELAHMWWGDMITCSDFKNIWINEGFATYSEALLIEATEGFESYKNQISTEEYYGPGTIYVNDTTDVNRIFNGQLSYSKAGYFLHMLRHVVGDENFFNIIKTYGSDPRYKYKDAGTEDFRGVCESVTGMNLEKFFAQWIYGEYFPEYSYGYYVDTTSNGFAVNLSVDQIQENAGLFWMPIDIRITTASGRETYVVWDSLQTQNYEIMLEEYPEKLEFDPDKWILKKTREKLVNASLDKGALLVNGLNWSLGDKVFSAYQNKSFWGNTNISFWDIFEEPAAGYPGSLPAPIGNGQLNISTLSEYSTVIWISHNYGGDLNSWNNLHMIDYLKAGGNIILITRMGRQFISSVLADYAGLEWNSATSNIIYNCISVYPGLNDMEFSLSHTIIDLVKLNLTKDYSTLLFKTNESLDEELGMGVWAKPNEGGQFVYIAARPYLIDHEDLRTNMQYITSNILGEPVKVEGEENKTIPAEFNLYQNYPNPFNPTTKIKYSILASKSNLEFRIQNSKFVSLTVYDILGREIITLVNKAQPPGNYEVEFDASKLTSGIYFYELASGNFKQTMKMLLLR
jgi:hypothetical protein